MQFLQTHGTHWSFSCLLWGKIKRRHRRSIMNIRSSASAPSSFHKFNENSYCESLDCTQLTCQSLWCILKLFALSSSEHVLQHQLILLNRKQGLLSSITTHFRVLFLYCAVIEPISLKGQHYFLEGELLRIAWRHGRNQSVDVRCPPNSPDT